MTASRPITQLAERIGEDWPSIRRADTETGERLARLVPVLEKATNPDVSVVVFGSLARREATHGSDVDWTLLVDGPSDPAHFDTAMLVDQELQRLGMKEPGAEGTFGGPAWSHDLIQRIGGSDDTNRNTTQRILFLLESAAIGQDDAYHRVVRNILTRYISEDWGWVSGRGPARVPRFLQNDLARYWRTVAVDFAYKRRARGGQGWALRTVKLRLSRKMIYASGLLACFSCDLEDVIPAEQSTGEAPTQKVVAHLEDRFGLPPLDMMSRTLLDWPELDHASAEIFGAYDAFLHLIDDPDSLGHLAELSPEASSGDHLYAEAREISHRFQKGLDGVFFENSTRISELTRIYGVF
jgi:predicted nucleotidyltransferase